MNVSKKNLLEDSLVEEVSAFDKMPDQYKQVPVRFTVEGMNQAEYLRFIFSYAFLRGAEFGNSRVSKKVKELITAVQELPVEDWVEQDGHGEPYLVGYVMQAQGEWDDVRRAIDKVIT